MRNSTGKIFSYPSGRPLTDRSCGATDAHRVYDEGKAYGS